MEGWLSQMDRWLDDGVRSSRFYQLVSDGALSPTVGPDEDWQDLGVSFLGKPRRTGGSPFGFNENQPKEGNKKTYPFEN